jgi:hypothetical protein
MDNYTYARDVALAVYKNRRTEARIRYRRALLAARKARDRELVIAEDWAEKRPQLRVDAMEAFKRKASALRHQMSRTLQWAAKDYSRLVR